MTESESVALPLGDTPMCRVCLDDLHIISKKIWFVNRFLKKSLGFFEKIEKIIKIVVVGVGRR